MSLIIVRSVVRVHPELLTEPAAERDDADRDQRHPRAPEEDPGEGPQRLGTLIGERERDASGDEDDHGANRVKGEAGARHRGHGNDRRGAARRDG